MGEERTQREDVSGRKRTKGTRAGYCAGEGTGKSLEGEGKAARFGSSKGSHRGGHETADFPLGATGEGREGCPYQGKRPSSIILCTVVL